MRDITKLMIAKYKLLELKYDFMGYEFDKEKELSTYSKKSKTTDRIYREIDCLKKQRRIYKKELVILANEARYHNISETIRVDSCHVY